MDNKELEAIIKLLDDPDNVVFNHIEQKLLSEGEIVIPFLEKAWENSLNEIVHQRVENIIHKIQYNSSFRNLEEWVNEESDDLLKGAFLIAKIQYPALDLQKLYQKIEKIKRNIWLELRDNFTPLEQVRVLNHILFSVYKFHGNNTDFYAPQNSYINEVLELKKGNPISLAIIYLIIAKRLGLPIYGVNLPKNFILAYLADGVDTTDLSNIDEERDILFYINPYNRGAVLGKKEIDFFLKQQKILPEKSFYTPCSYDIIIQRLILNLSFSYQKLGYNDKVKDFEKLLTIFNERLGNTNKNLYG